MWKEVGHAYLNQMSLPTEQRSPLLGGDMLRMITLDGAKAYFFDGCFDLTETLDNQKLIENQDNSYGQYGYELFKPRLSLYI